MDRFEQTLIVCLLTPLGDPNGEMCQWGIVPNYTGGSGVGKSSRINVVTRAMGLPCYPIFAASKTPEHIGGFPANTPEGFMLRCALPQVLNAMDDQRAVIFLDEISTAPPAVQAALLSFVNERTVGEYTLPLGVRIVMAMNPADMAANGHDLEVPMANRVAHFAYTPPPAEQWGEHVQGRYRVTVPPLLNGEAIIRKNWNEHFPVIAALAADFMLANNGQYNVKDSEGNVQQRSKLYDQPDSTDPRASGPWPSHRTWTWAVHGVAAARCLGFDTGIETDIVAALVGEGLAVEWATYARKLDLPQPKDVLERGLKVPRRIDMARIILNSCSSWVVSIPDPEYRVQMATACWQLLDSAVTEAGYSDIAIKPMAALVHQGLDTTHENDALVDACESVCAKLAQTGHLKYLK